MKPFYRYEGAVITDRRRMPQVSMSASTSPRSVGELVGRFEKFTANDEERLLYPWADRFVMGYPLAPWQRVVRWSHEQMAAFITSIWMDVDLGSYLVNDIIEFTSKPGEKLVSQYLSDILLDGQQRLTALQLYLLNEFQVPDANGNPCFWDDLGKTERRFFCNKTFSMSRVQSFDEAELRKVYNLRAFGGVAHAPEERA
jgi:hypothetical protein